MATNPETDLGQHGLVGDDARAALESMRVKVTGSPCVSLRSLALLMVVGVVCALAPWPVNVVGVLAVVLLAHDQGRRK